MRVHDRDSKVAEYSRHRAAFAACVLFPTALVTGACVGADTNDSSGFGSPERAADAFAAGDLPDIGPWDDADGLCRVLLVGDSLVEATLSAQAEAFEYMGCESIVDGLTARSLSDGWQCLADGGRSMAITLTPFPEPGNTTCRPSGLELLRQWSDYSKVASATVIALGTNDAGIHSEEMWIRRWSRVVDMTSGPLVFVTVGARPGDKWVDNATRYNATLRTWCPSQPRCVLAEWDLTEPALDPASYIDHVHLTREVGEMRAVFIAVSTRRAAIAAVLGPQQWRAPSITFPPTTTSSTTLAPQNSGPVSTGSVPWSNSSTLPTPVTSTTTAGSTTSTSSTTTSTTTTIQSQPVNTSNP